jgi:hypothetical protein
LPAHGNRPNAVGHPPDLGSTQHGVL